MSNKLNLEQTAEVREHKKYHHTVVPVKDILAHRAARKEFEEEWQREFLKREAERAAKAKSAVAEQNLELKFSETEKSEIAWVRTRNMKLSIYEPIHPCHRLQHLYVEPKLSFSERAKAWIINFISGAFEK